MAIRLDEHGQPPSAANARSRTERHIAELLGIAKGLLADGVVNNQEIEYLEQWAASHPEAREHWPECVVFARLQRALSDGRIDEDDRTELKAVLTGLVGGTVSMLLGEAGTSELPLDVPPPLICWAEEVYVFTGRMAYASRAVCAREVVERGGSVEENVTRRTTFLVLGTFGSRDWTQSSYGRKIQRAQELRDAGFPLRIVSEDHWAEALERVTT